MSNLERSQPDDDPRGGTYEEHPNTTAAIRRHLEAVPEPPLAPLTREEAIAQARAALEAAERKHFPD